MITKTLTVNQICTRWQFDRDFVETVIREDKRFPSPVRTRYRFIDLLRYESVMPWVRKLRRSTKRGKSLVC